MESPSRLCSNCGSINCSFFADSCCVLHCGNGSSDGKIIRFVDHTLDKCRTVLSIRKTKNLKYKEVVLPENVNNKKTGYHAECYRKFIALGRNAPPKNDNVESKSVHIILKKYSGKWFIINKNYARNMYLFYQERQKTQRQ